GAMVGSRQRLVEGKVLLDDGGAASRGGNGDLDAERVIGEAHRVAEARSEAVHGAQVDFLYGRRVGGETVEQGQRRVARGANGGDRLLDLFESRHARR